MSAVTSDTFLNRKLERCKMSIYDVPELKDQIKKLKLTKSQLENDKNSLEEELQKCEIRFNTLKQEMNIAGAADEVRLFADDVSVTDPIDNIDPKRFKVFNDKLDIQLLNQEIRLALPHLQAEASLWEGRFKGLQKLANKTQKETKESEGVLERDASSTLLKTKEEIEAEIGELLDRKFQIKSKITKDIESKRNEKNMLSAEISSLRRRLQQLRDEKDMLISSTNRITLETKLDGERYKVLINDFERQRNLLGELHNGYGWQTEAFISETKSTKDTILVSKLPQLLTQWLNPDYEALLTEDYIREQLDIIIRREQQTQKGEKATSSLLLSSTSKPNINEFAVADAKKSNENDEVNFNYDDIDDELMGNATSYEFDIIKNNNNNAANKTNTIVDDEYKQISKDLLSIREINFHVFCQLCDRIVVVNSTD